MAENKTMPYAVDIAFKSEMSNNPLSGLRGIVWSCSEGLATNKLIDTALKGVEYTVGNKYVKDLRANTNTYSDYSHEIERAIQVDGITVTKGKDFRRYQEVLLANEMMESDGREGHKRENNFNYLERAGLILDHFRSGKSGIIK